ncbi:hypothetical protein ColTof3_06782 [Colletotrichum tofieldiae]|nr:hypothetical protein ColTof3_06782 [Colletotrichum tofieldiae]
MPAEEEGVVDAFPLLVGEFCGGEEDSGSPPCALLMDDQSSPSFLALLRDASVTAKSTSQWSNGG